MPQIKCFNQFRTCRETTLPQKAVFVSVQADRNCLIPTRYENRSLMLFRLFSRLDLLYTGRLGGLVQRFSAFARTPSLLTGRFSASQSDRYAVFANRYDANFLNVLRCVASLEAINIRHPVRLPISFVSNGKWLASAPLRRDAINTAARLLVPSKFTSVTPQLQKIGERFSALNILPIFKITGKCDCLLLYRLRTASRFAAIDEFAGSRLFKLPIRYAERLEAMVRLCNSFGPGFAYQMAMSAFRFDAQQNYFARQNANCFSLVKPGWRIVATDIATGEKHDIGFIDADAIVPEIAGVYLPDGDYEISVLTSSLFWKDTLYHENRLLSIRLDEDISPLPTIYNVRTSVAGGTRTLYWSAGKSELEDCVFGVWFSDNTPVDTIREPDKTVWYSPEMTEYSVSFSQNTPCFASVAAIRTGDNPETGKAHELFLDWRSTPPRQPDDTTILETKHD